MTKSKVLLLIALLCPLFLSAACSNDEPLGLSAADDDGGDASDNDVTDSDNDTDTDTDSGDDDTDNDVEDSDNTVVEDPDTGTSVDPDFLQISLDAPVGTTATIHKYGETWDTECKIGVADDPSDIQCIVEGIELGLHFFNGTFKLNYNIPEGLCKFTRVVPYYFYQRLAGTGPHSYTLTTTDDVPVLSAVVDDNASITAQLDVDGNVVCTTNYTDILPAALNCCEGDVVVTERVIDTVNATDTTTIAHSDWGGKIANCLVGPAMDTQTLNIYGYPQATLYNMEGIGLNRDYEIESPLSKEYLTNLYIANYFDISASFDADGEFIWATAPDAIEGLEVRANPFYRFECLDEADDYIHRVRVLIRSWSSEEQYALGEAGAFDAGTNGEGEAFFAQQPLLDLYGWFDSPLWDLMTEYPEGGL